jgi:hypothetical protein
MQVIGRRLHALRKKHLAPGIDDEVDRAVHGHSPPPKFASSLPRLYDWFAGFSAVSGPKDPR